MRAQIQIIDQIRRGVTIKVLEGKSLDEIPTTVCWESANEFAKRGLGPDEAPVAEQAMDALRRAVVCHKDDSGELKYRHTSRLRDQDRMAEFTENTLDEQGIF